MNRVFPMILVILSSVLPAGILNAELAVFNDGRVLRVEDAFLEGDNIRLELIGGGTLLVPALRIDRVVNDEIDHSEASPYEEHSSCNPDWRPVTLDPSIPFAGLIEEAAKVGKLNPKLLVALVRAESNFDRNAVSRVGARGLTQLMPAAAADTGVTRLFDPGENLRGGALYLRHLLDRFDSLELALAAYNAGAATVKRYEGVPPFRETRSYVKKILAEFCSTTS